MTNEIKNLQDFIDSSFGGNSQITILEAGCGSASRLKFPQNAYLVGIDISIKQLERNHLVNKRILGDIQDYEFPAESFDAIVCWDVLEHLPQPQKALKHFFSALKPHGVLILKLPNVFSLKGLVAKGLPYPMHLFYARLIVGNKNAGKDEAGPFKTYLKFSIAPNAIKKFSRANGLDVVHFETFDISGRDWLKRNKMAIILYTFLRFLVATISFGRISDSEYIMILKKK